MSPRPAPSPGPTGWWDEATARVEADAAADLAAEVAEVYVAEAARCRLVDRRGRARVTVRSGVCLDGVLEPGAGLDGHLCLRGDTGATVLVPEAAILTVTGSRSALRDEGSSGGRSLASRLREAWQSGTSVRVITASGAWLGGTVRMVGADHVELDPDTGSSVVVPFAAVEAWVL